MSRFAATRPEAHAGPVVSRHPTSWSPASTAAQLIAVVSVTAALLSFVLAAENGQSFADLIEQHAVTPVLMGATLAVIGAFVVGSNSRNALAWLFCAQGPLQCLSAVGAQYAAHSPTSALAGLAAFAAAYAWAPGMLILLCLTIPLFPDGHTAGRAWRALFRVGLLVTGIGTITGICSDAPMRAQFPAFYNPIALPPSWQPLLEAIFDGCIVVAAALALLGVIATIIRAVRTSGRARGQAIWLLSAFALGTIGQLLDGVSAVFPAIGWPLFGVALGVAMIRGGLYDGDRMLNRSLLSSAVAGVLAAAVGLTAGVVAERISGVTIGAVIAAIVVALALDPVRRLVRGTVDRILFGAGRDPFEAVERLGARLATAIAPDDALLAVTETVTSALRLPAASIILEGESEPIVVTGVLSGNSVSLPLVHAGVQVGTLMVGLPGTRRFLDPLDERLLTELARQAGTAADLVRLNRELRRSRDAVLVARDSERQRIRRDLHDGLGPALAGISLGIGAARVNAPDDHAADLLDGLRAEVDELLQEVKALIAQLHPPVLDQVGLDTAIRRRLAMLTEHGAEGGITARLDIPPLPALVETAAYRIVSEAITNVMRHAKAATVDVDVHGERGELMITVTDDGVGISASTDPVGVGLGSMRDRALELGGRCMILPRSGGGTVVSARLPLGGSSGRAS
ncbi:MAG: GAF domain-containing sensor histidine kinase [Actinobacteria bacterium]|nr:GAF domain-containing sensor histidine kinase [Actinomycetota bacterium]